MPIFCIVCKAKTDGRVRNGIKACQSCKSFFLAHCKQPDDLQCRTGKEDCEACELPTISTQFVIKNGNIWRFSCTRCRYKKCLEAGMWSSNARPLLKQENIKSPEDKRCIALEMNTKVFGEGFYKLFNRMDQYLPGRIRICTTKDEIFQCQVDNFTSMTEWASDFLTSVPGYSTLAVKDQMMHFSAGFNMLCCFLCLFLNLPMGMSHSNFKCLLTFSTDFEDFTQENQMLTRFLHEQVRPNVLEFAFMAVHLFLGDKNPPMLVTAHINSVIMEYLGKKYVGNMEQALKRYQFLVCSSKFLLEKCKLRLIAQVLESQESSRKRMQNQTVVPVT